MTKDPKKMQKAEIIEKVLEINPNMRLGDQSVDEMAEYLMETVRDRKRPRKFSDDKYVAVFRGMLSELESKLDAALIDVHKRQEALTNRHKLLKEKYRTRIVEFLVGTNPGPLTRVARQAFGDKEELLEALGLTVGALDRMVRNRSAEIE